MKYALSHIYVAFLEPDGTPKPQLAYHVEVMQEPETLAEWQTAKGRQFAVLTMSQAHAAGFTLPALIAEVNTAAMRDKEAAQAALASAVVAHQAAIATLTAERDAALAELDAMTKSRERVLVTLSEAQARIAELEAASDE